MFTLFISPFSLYVLRLLRRSNTFFLQILYPFPCTFFLLCTPYTCPLFFLSVFSALCSFFFLFSSFLYSQNNFTRSSWQQRSEHRCSPVQSRSPFTFVQSTSTSVSILCTKILSRSSFKNTAIFFG